MTKSLRSWRWWYPLSNSQTPITILFTKDEKKRVFESMIIHDSCLLELIWKEKIENIELKNTYKCGEKEVETQLTSKNKREKERI